jgi:hypothetical protein
VRCYQRHRLHLCKASTSLQVSSRLSTNTPLHPCPPSILIFQHPPLPCAALASLDRHLASISAPLDPNSSIHPLVSPSASRMLRQKPEDCVVRGDASNCPSHPLRSPACDNARTPGLNDGSGNKRNRPPSDENARPPSPSIKRTPHRAPPTVTPVSAATCAFTPKATPSRTAATPSRTESSSRNKPPGSACATRTPLSSRKRPSTPINSVEMNRLPGRGQRQAERQPPSLGFAAANAAHAQFLSSKACATL